MKKKKHRRFERFGLSRITCHRERNCIWRLEYDLSRRAGEIGSDIRANDAMNKSFMWIFTFMRNGEYNSSDVHTDMK